MLFHSSFNCFHNVFKSAQRTRRRRNEWGVFFFISFPSSYGSQEKAVEDRSFRFRKRFEGKKKEGRVGGAEPPNIIRASETCAFVKCHDSQKHVRHIASYPLPLPPLWSLFLFFCYFLFLFTQVSSIKRGRVMQRELTCLLLLVANSFQMTSTTTPKTARNLYN